MSLYQDAMQNCVRYSRADVPDVEGGHKPAWTPGDTFQAALVLINSNEDTKAQAKDLARRYRVYTERATVLHYYDLFKRGSQAYRVITADSATPPTAHLDLRVVEAEQITMEGDIDR